MVEPHGPLRTVTSLGTHKQCGLQHTRDERDPSGSSSAFLSRVTRRTHTSSHGDISLSEEDTHLLHSEQEPNNLPLVRSQRAAAN
jgi:hypothetical protein